MSERLAVPVEALQADGQGIAHADVGRGEHDRALQQPQRLLELAVMFELRGRHVEQQRVLKAGGERLLGNRRRARELAPLGQCAAPCAAFPGRP